MAIVGISHGPEISVEVRSGMVGSEGDKGKKGKILPGLEGPPIDGVGWGSLSAEGTAQLGPSGRELKLLSSLLSSLEVLDLDLCVNSHFPREFMITSRTQGRCV